jgi:hypothetical protein
MAGADDPDARAHRSSNGVILAAAALSPADWIAIAGIAGVIGLPIATALLKVANKLGGIEQQLHDHGRRLEVIETVQTEGPSAGKRRKHELEEADV